MPCARKAWAKTRECSCMRSAQGAVAGDERLAVQVGEQYPGGPAVLGVVGAGGLGQLRAFSHGSLHMSKTER